MEYDEATNEVHRLASLMPRGAGAGLSTSVVRHDQLGHAERLVREGDDKQDRAPDKVPDGALC